MTDDPWRLSAIAHAHVDVASPLTSGTLDSVLDLMGDLTGARALDIGCGAGEVLVRLAERGARATGYDVSPYAVQRSTDRVAARVPDAGVTVLQQDAAPAGPFDVVTCVGSSQALSPESIPGLFGPLRALLAPAGRALVADGYWKRPPDPDYLEALGGASSEETTDLDGLVDAARDAGFSVVHVVEATEDDWLAYEDAVGEGLRAHVREHPDDPQAGRFLDRASAWGERFERWGKQTLGFATLYCVVDD